LKEKIAKNEGFGLFNVRERLKHLKGELDIQSKKGHGTAVTIIAPLGVVQ
jgi:signal transduction histidine kinase